MSDAHGVARDQLRSFVERVERIESEIKDLNDDKSDVYGEARSMGFDVKVLKKVVAKRKMDSAKRDEEDAIFDMYWHALHGSDLVHARTRENIEEFPASDGSPASVSTPMTTLGAEESVVPHSPETADDMHERPSYNDKPCSKTAPQGKSSPAGTGSELLAGREGRHDGEVASAYLPTNSSSSEQPHAGGKDVELHTAAIQAGAIVTSAPAAKTARDYRPNCLRPEACGSSGLSHCYSCTKAMQKAEEFA